MKRSPIRRKRPTKRRTLSPRCEVRGCTRPARIAEFCRPHAIRACDVLARAQILGESCTACGSASNLQWSHHITRGRLRIRWARENSTTHCRDCHARFTHAPALHHAWIIGHIGQPAFDELLDIAYGPIGEDGVRTLPGPVNDPEIGEWLEKLRAAA